MQKVNAYQNAKKKMNLYQNNFLGSKLSMEKTYILYMTSCCCIKRIKNLSTNNFMLHPPDPR